MEAQKQNYTQTDQDIIDTIKINESIVSNVTSFLNEYPEHDQILKLIFNVKDQKTLLSENYELNKLFIELADNYEGNKDLLHKIRSLLQMKIDIDQLKNEGIEISFNIRELLEESLV